MELLSEKIAEGSKRKLRNPKQNYASPSMCVGVLRWASITLGLDTIWRIIVTPPIASEMLRNGTKVILVINRKWDENKCETACAGVHWGARAKHPRISRVQIEDDASTVNRISTWLSWLACDVCARQQPGHISIRTNDNVELDMLATYCMSSGQSGKWVNSCKEIFCHGARRSFGSVLRTAPWPSGNTKSIMDVVDDVAVIMYALGVVLCRARG